MKFFEYYEDLIAENRRYSDDKFEAIAKKMPNWLLDEFGSKPSAVISMPMYSEFRKYLLNKGEQINNEEDVILGFSALEDWLNEIDAKTSQKFLTLVGQRFPAVGEKIKRWDKPEGWTPGKRGRKPGSKNKPKSDFADLSMTTVTMDEPQVVQPEEPEMTLSLEPKRRGRKPSEESLKKLVAQYDKMHDDLISHVSKMKELMQKINQRRSYFGKDE